MTVEQKEKLLKRFIKSKAKEHGLTDWQFYSCDTLRKEVSYAHCKPQLKTIYLQAQSIGDLSLHSLQDLVLHEMAHAIAGSEAKHGAEFRKACKQIGCKGNRANNNYECYDLHGKFPWQLYRIAKRKFFVQLMNVDNI